MTTVLFVEDHADTRDIVSLILSSHGFAVKTVDNFYSAIEVLKHESSNIKLMLLDYNLPGMPMGSFLEEVRKVRPNLPIVLTTASYRVEEKARQHDINWWIPKPIDPSKLLEVVAELSTDKRSTNTSCCA
jgi:CheY-like chemotaxis protein